jgi:hypothetical protein
MEFILPALLREENSYRFEENEGAETHSVTSGEAICFGELSTADVLKMLVGLDTWHRTESIF